VSLLAVPNFSEGRDTSVIAAIRGVLDADRGLLDRHSDSQHNRTVYTVFGEGRDLVELLVAAARVAIERIDMRRHRGLHPCVGALDVCPLVWLDAEGHEPARLRARSVAERIAGLGVPVFLYGELASSEERRERAHFREGGLPALRERMIAGKVAPDFGPALPHLTAGATLVAARPPLAAFNIELDAADPLVAQRIATALRERGGGLAGVRAIGLPLEGGRTQVSTNVQDPIAVPLREVVARVRELAAQQGARPVEAEVVGLVPQAAMQDFPAELPLRGFDPERHVIERRLA
jgi:glutamate formiminotransferase / 5-formyltetrahydrofolate cyclo-ligase